MLSARLPLARDAGMIDDPVRVWGAPGDMDFSALPPGSEAVQDLQPERDRLVARGITVTRTPGGPLPLGLVCLPRARDLARDRIARAAATSERLLIDGQKTDGIDAMLRECRSRGEVGEVISKAHGKIFAFAPNPTAWAPLDPYRIDGGYLTAPGSFSADGVDPGSQLLADSMPPLSGHVVDLGAGWGYLAARALASEAVHRVDLVEADARSLDCARQNLDDPRAAYHWADATEWRPDRSANVVVANPPFHRGRIADPSLGRAFIASAAAALAPGGTLYLVANRHLPYENALNDRFARVDDLPGTTRFKLFRATRPRRAS